MGGSGLAWRHRGHSRSAQPSESTGSDLRLVAVDCGSPHPTRTRPRLKAYAPRRLDPAQHGWRARRHLPSVLYSAVAQTSVSLATLVTFGTAPAMVLVGEQLTGRRRIDRQSVAVLALALLGLALLIGFPSGAADQAHLAAGIGFAVGSAAAFATFTLVCAVPVPGLDEMTTTGVGFPVGALLLAPVAAVTGRLSFVPDATSLLLLLLGAVPTALAYLCWFRGLVDVRPATAAMTALLEPLTGAVLGALILGDRLGWVGVLGAALLGGAVLLAGLAERRSGPTLVPAAPASRESAMTDPVAPAGAVPAKPAPAPVPEGDFPLHVLEDDETVPPRPEEDAAEAVRLARNK